MLQKRAQQTEAEKHGQVDHHHEQTAGGGGHNGGSLPLRDLPGKHRLSELIIQPTQ